jgi:CRISPR system Cascade subunit CasD
MRFLLFTLYGPMASWGKDVVGDDRGTWTAPSKSAMIGLLGAALGIRRTDKQIDPQDYGLAVMVRSSGIILTDFHTVQIPRTVRVNKEIKAYPTRRAEIEAFVGDDKVNPIVSRRDYLCDALFIVGLWKVGETGRSLEELQAALLRPAFTLYLGRKSCPLGLPLGPVIMESPTLKEAFETTDLKFDKIIGLPSKSEHVARPIFEKFLQNSDVEVFWDQLEDSGYVPEQVVSFRDVPVNRKSWTFRERDVNRLTYTLQKERQDVSE